VSRCFNRSSELGPFRGNPEYDEHPPKLSTATYIQTPTATIIMPWPTKIVRQFEMVPPNPSETDFYGPYNKLLYSLFPADTEFTVVPMHIPNYTREGADYIVMFEVHLEDRPVFTSELRPPKHLRLASSRHAADVQIRTRIRDIARSLKLS